MVCESAVPCIETVIKKWHTQKQLTIGTCTNPHQCPSEGKPRPPGSQQVSCQACLNWVNALETVEYTDQTQGVSTSIAWTNINPTVLFQDPVEVAKAFCIRLPKGEPPPTTFHGFDTASLLLMMMKFGEFHQRDHASYLIIKKVGTIGVNDESYRQVGLKKIRRVKLDGSTECQLILLRRGYCSGSQPPKLVIPPAGVYCFHILDPAKVLSLEPIRDAPL